jgi:hypothetical protein
MTDLGKLIGGFVILLVVVTGAYLSGRGSGYASCEHKCREAAIAAGAAEWRVDPKTGVTSFHFLPPPAPAKPPEPIFPNGVVPPHKRPKGDVGEKE